MRDSIMEADKIEMTPDVLRPMWQAPSMPSSEIESSQVQER